MAILLEPTELPSNNIYLFFANKRDVAKFVSVLLKNFPETLPLTMTISRARSGASYVLTAINVSLEDTVILNSCFEQVNT